MFVLGIDFELHLSELKLDLGSEGYDREYFFELHLSELKHALLGAGMALADALNCTYRN